MSSNYEQAISNILEKPTNLYGIQLRPGQEDPVSGVKNPIFTICRTNDSVGNPDSVFYNAMTSIYLSTDVAAPDPKAQIIQAVSRVLSESSSLGDIQNELHQQFLQGFKLDIDFTKDAHGAKVNQEYIDTLMGEGITKEEKIETLLDACALNIWDTLPTLPSSPFYSISKKTPEAEKTEKLSILTQFFLANLNVYCKAHEIFELDFGKVLDNSKKLSKDLVSMVSNALTNGRQVESEILNFVSSHQNEFGMTRPIVEEDMARVKQTFERNYRTVKDSQHMDDFMILDKDAQGETAKLAPIKAQYV